MQVTEQQYKVLCSFSRDGMEFSHDDMILEADRTEDM